MHRTAQLILIGQPRCSIATIYSVKTSSYCPEWFVQILFHKTIFGNRKKIYLTLAPDAILHGIIHFTVVMEGVCVHPQPEMQLSEYWSMAIQCTQWLHLTSLSGKPLTYTTAVTRSKMTVCKCKCSGIYIIKDEVIHTGFMFPVNDVTNCPPWA